MMILSLVRTEKYNVGTISKHAAFLSRYFNHEPCTNNAGLATRDALHKTRPHGRPKLISMHITCVCLSVAVCKGTGTQRHRITFSWKSCNQATLWTWHVRHSGLAGALMPWDHPITPQYEFTLQSSEENEHHTTVAIIFLHFVYFLRTISRAGARMQNCTLWPGQAYSLFT